MSELVRSVVHTHEVIKGLSFCPSIQKVSPQNIKSKLSTETLYFLKSHLGVKALERMCVCVCVCVCVCPDDSV
jgi:hypothetical protein